MRHFPFLLTSQHKQCQCFCVCVDPLVALKSLLKGYSAINEKIICVILILQYTHNYVNFKSLTNKDVVLRKRICLEYKGFVNALFFISKQLRIATIFKHVSFCQNNTIISTLKVKIYNASLRNVDAEKKLCFSFIDIFPFSSCITRS